MSVKHESLLRLDHFEIEIKKMLKQVYKTIYDSFTFWKINISTSYVVNIITLHMKY